MSRLFVCTCFVAAFVGSLAAQAPRGLIDAPAFRQDGNRGSMQFAWRFDGLVQMPRPLFRGLVYGRFGGEDVVVVSGSEWPETDSVDKARGGGRVPSRGKETLTFELPAGLALVDYRVEMWLNGSLVGNRHSPKFNAVTFKERGFDVDWWNPKPGVVGPDLRAEIKAGIEAGVTYLKGKQMPSGSWDGGEGSASGYTALVAMALIKSGTPKDAPEIVKALVFLKRARSTATYDVGCTLMLLELVDPKVHRGWMEDLAALLVRRQAKGTWDYNQGNGDLSNTQYAVLGLWAAERAGIEIDKEVWRDLGEALARYANPNGSFNYQPLVREVAAHSGTLEMTAAGLGNSLICHRMLQGDQRAEKILPQIELANRKGLAAMARLFGDDSSGYSLYGLERACSLAGHELLGRRDWYVDGSKQFLERQEKDGSIDERHGGTIAGTSFALLFWRRSTMAAVDPGYDPDAYARESGEGMVADAEPAVDPPAVAEPVDAVEATLNERFPMAEVGKEVLLKSADGKSVRGVVEALEEKGVRLLVNGRSGLIPFERLDKSSRVRCDAAYRSQVLEAQRRKK